MLKVFTIFYLVSCIHIISIALSAKLLDVTNKQISFGFGKKLFSYRLISLSLIPLGGFVKLADSRHGKIEPHDKLFNLQPLWKQLLIPLCGPLVTLIVAWICLGSGVFDSFIGTFNEVYRGAMSPTESAQEYLSKIELFSHENTTLILLGAISAKLSALNLIPLSGTIGGQTIFTLINRGRQQKPFEEKLFQVFFWPYALMYISWLIGIIYWI